MLVRFTAAALICVTILQLSLYYIDFQHNGRPIPIVQFILWTIPLVAGVALLIKSKPIADWISDRIDQ